MKSLNITILGEKDIGKTKLIDEYTENKYEKKQKGSAVSFHKTFKDSNKMKLSLYEFSDIPDKKKDIASHHCVIIMI